MTEIATGLQPIIDDNGDFAGFKRNDTGAENLVPRYVTTANGNTVLVGAGGVEFPGFRLTKARQAMRALSVGQPSSMVVYGDSTGNNDDEWVRLLTGYIATAYPALTINYRVWNNSSQQYDQPTVVSTGTAGAKHVDTGSAAASWRVYIPHSAATSITGDIDVRAKICLNGSVPSAPMAIGGKLGSATNRSWMLEVTTGGNLLYTWSADGSTNIAKASTVALSGALLSDVIWVRARHDVNDGAGNNTVTFYTSPDNSTWTQLGATVTTTGTTSIYASTIDTQFIGRNQSYLPQQDHDIGFYEFEVYAALDGTSRVIDIDLGAFFNQDTPGNWTFIDDVGNACTVVTSNAGAMVGGTFSGAPRFAVFNGSTSATAISYAHDAGRYPKLTIGTPAIAMISYSMNEGIDIAYRADYKTLTDKLIATNPDMAIVAVLQNPRIAPAINITHHALRMQQVSQFAASQGFDVLDVFSNWDDSYTNTDGIHPNSAGSVHWAGLAKSHLGV